MVITIEQRLRELLGESHKRLLPLLADEVLMDFRLVHAYVQSPTPSLFAKKDQGLQQIVERLGERGVRVPVGELLRLRDDYCWPRLANGRWRELEQELERLATHKPSRLRRFHLPKAS